ncbi:MAG: TonB-dependent receptor [Carboxylicivirga sp.]|nr:TonB-dependent receptor [Carboxylicivirga sp.]
MKLSIVLMLIGMLQVSASVSSQNKVSLKASNKKVAEVLKQIETETNLRFFYNETLINDQRTVSIQAKDAEVEQVLEQLFEGTDVQYRYFDDELILLTKPEQAAQHNNQQAQSITVKGVVQDASGEPLPGVNVYEKGNVTNGVITGIDGTYSISIASDAVVIYSFIGFKDQEVNVNGRTNLNIVLLSDTEDLDEVVVIGYGTKSKATLTGAVESVSELQFESRPQVDVAQSIQGAIPGLLVTRGSGKPGGEDAFLQIRGRASRSGAGVLVVIDGIPQPENSAQALNDINPQDIENLTVLKDAQAAIYGSRAAGGVILITTKKGKTDKPVIKYSGNFAYNVPDIYAPKANIYDQSDYYNEAFGNDGITQHAYTYLDELLPTIDPNNPQVIKGPFPDVPKMWSGYYDWMDIMFDPSFQQTHQLSVSGKSDKSNYYVSAGMLDQPGMMAHGSNYNKRYFSRFKYKFDIIDELSISTNVALEKQKIVLPSRYDLAVDLAGSVWSTHFPRTPEGNYFNFGGFQNPIAYAEAGGENESVATRASAQFKVDFRPFKGFELTSEYSTNIDHNVASAYNKIIQHHDYDENPTIEVPPNSAGSSLHRNEHHVFNMYANYKKSIGQHNIGAMFGGSHEENEYKYFTAGRSKLVSEAVPILTLGDPELQTTHEERTHWAISSYFGRLSYDFKGRYIVDGTYRRDGSSRFAEDYRWGNYLGGSAAWIMTEESFMQSLGFLDYLKLRLSYGELGNQNNVGLYDHISVINIGGQMLFGNPNSPTKNLIATFGDPNRADRPGSLASPTRTWETVAIQNIGVDFRVLNSKLSGSFDYFIKNTKDMLVAKEFPEMLGIAPSSVNGGEMQVKGWELSLNWNDKIGSDFNYFARFTLADDKSEITSLDDSQVPKYGQNEFVEGNAYNSYYTLQFDGFIANEEELVEYKKITGVPSNLRVGDARYKDRDGDGTIEYTAYQKGDPDSGDLVNIGNSSIRYQYGITMGFDFKGFDFSAFFQGVGQWNVMSGVKPPGSSWWVTPLQATIGKSWTEENPNSFYPKSSTNGGIDGWNFQNSDAPYKWSDAKYIRLKNIQVGYTLPGELTKKVKLDRVRVYFSGNDIWEKTNMPDGFDPERPFATLYTPIPRAYSFGIDVTL